MRLFAYYVVHSFLNTLKKLFKTWVAVFVIICFAIGLFAGILSASLSSLDENSPGPEGTEIVSNAGYDYEITIENDVPDFMAKRSISKNTMIELVISGIIILMLMITMLTAKSASAIFKPGDVTILFPSPMKPQSVMLFRLIASLGLQLLVSIYLVAQLPNLVNNLGLSIWVALALIFAWSILLITGTILQVIIYTLGSKHPFISRYASGFIIGFILFIIAIYAIYANRSGDYLTAAVNMFTGKATYAVPFWGWLRAFCMYAIEGNTGMALLFMGITLASFAILIFAIWRIDADFYEDAISSVEKTSERIENAKSGKALTTRKKERRSSLMRDGFHYGSGANVFFFKALYNRYRFGILHIFSITSILYTAIAGIVSYACINFESEKTDAFTIPALLLALCVFYRTLGNPLKEDTDKDFFVMIPENMYTKLWWSLIGGSVCCLLDIIIPFILSGIMLGTDVPVILGWMLVVLSINFFGTTVGTFINLSVPINGANGIKQALQMIFIYFGIMPSAILLIIGIATGNLLLFAIIATLVNLGTAAIFFAITPKFLINGKK